MSRELPGLFWGHRTATDRGPAHLAVEAESEALCGQVTALLHYGSDANDERCGPCVRLLALIDTARKVHEDDWRLFVRANPWAVGVPR